MKPLDWWIGILLLASALFMHACVPRYHWHLAPGEPPVRIDRWIGEAEQGQFVNGRWISTALDETNTHAD